ncbi:hypothetical protein ACTWP4_15100 [Gracilibacillus sp. D59]|uniref:hypothetical protein n=1 Tax=Gracilibacillus sp. D59 TaxID=3457434 RepID=UPI003FCC5F00
MVKKSLFFILIIFVLLGACNQQSSEINENVKKVVWSYIETKGNDGFYNKELWDRLGVEKVKLEDKYKKYIENTYDGEEIFLVSTYNQNVVASPTFLVDQDIEDVIGVIPGSNNTS